MAHYHRVRYVHVNGVDLEYVEQGTGVPVVFSHGGSSDIRYWEPQREEFARRYRFVAYSRRHHGVTPWPANRDDSADAHAADLLEIVRRLGVGPAHVIGFSTAIALRATLREAALVRSLTIIEPNVPWLLEGDRDGEATLAWWRAENDRLRTEAGDDTQRRAALWFELVNNRGSGAFDTQPEALRRMWLDNFDRSRPQAPAPEPLTCERLRAIATPTLVIGAEYGMPYSRMIVDRIADCLLDGRRLVIDGATHFMSHQEPDRFNRAVLAFLEKH